MSVSPFLVALHKALSLTPTRFARVKAYFQADYAAAWSASDTTWHQVGLDPRGLAAFLRRRPTVDPDALMASLAKCGATILSRDCTAYPLCLKDSPAPPTLLFVRGRLQETDFPAISIVGSRAVTPYGKRAVETFIQALVPYGVTILSGLAFGADTHAHKIALKHGLRTIGVMGSGIDSIYPKNNARWVQSFLEQDQGAILSEYFPGTEVRPDNFPVRNRIVAGLSRAVIVVEAKERSGSLITARLGVEAGREVFAVPGDIYAPASQGTNLLLAKGMAHPAISPDFLIETLGLTSSTAAGSPQSVQMTLPLTPEEIHLMDAFGVHAQRHMDDLIRATSLPTHQVAALISMLELKGILRHMGANIYAKQHVA